MTKNLETADLIVKLILALSAVIFYFTHIISGPVARVLMILGALVIIIFVARTLLILLTRD